MSLTLQSYNQTLSESLSKRNIPKGATHWSEFFNSWLSITRDLDDNQTKITYSCFKWDVKNNLWRVYDSNLVEDILSMIAEGTVVPRPDRIPDVRDLTSWVNCNKTTVGCLGKLQGLSIEY